MVVEGIGLGTASRERVKIKTRGLRGNLDEHRHTQPGREVGISEKISKKLLGGERAGKVW